MNQPAVVTFDLLTTHCWLLDMEKPGTKCNTGLWRTGEWSVHCWMTDFGRKHITKVYMEIDTRGCLSQSGREREFA